MSAGVRRGDPRRPSGATVLVAAAVVAWAAWWGWRSWAVSGLSWHFFADGSRLLLHGSGHDLYAEHPELQIGPLSLVVPALLGPLPNGLAEHVALVAMAATGPLLLAVLAPLVPAAHRHRRVLLAALFLLPAWTVLAVRWGHLDDVLAMAGAVGAVRAVVARRPLWAGAALAVAMASKPWAIGFLPLLLALPRGQWRAAAAAAVGTALAWLPFVVVNPATLGALHPPVALVRSSGLHTLGVRGETVPGWGRTLQLLLSPAIALAAVLAGRWAGVLLVAVAARLAVDPQDNAYYVGSAALAAVVFDLLGTRWTMPWATVATVVALWQPFVLDYPHRLTTTTGLTHWWFAHPGTVGAVHLAWAVAMVVVVFVHPRTCEPGDPAIS